MKTYLDGLHKLLVLERDSKGLRGTNLQELKPRFAGSDLTCGFICSWRQTKWTNTKPDDSRLDWPSVMSLDDVRASLGKDKAVNGAFVKDFIPFSCIVREKRENLFFKNSIFSES